MFSVIPKSWFNQCCRAPCYTSEITISFNCTDACHRWRVIPGARSLFFNLDKHNESKKLIRTHPEVHPDLLVQTGSKIFSSMSQAHRIRHTCAVPKPGHSISGCIYYSSHIRELLTAGKTDNVSQLIKGKAIQVTGVHNLIKKIYQSHRFLKKAQLSDFSKHILIKSTGFLGQSPLETLWSGR